MKIKTLNQFKTYAGRYYDRFETTGLTVAGAIARVDERIRNARAQVQTLVSLRKDIKTHNSVRQARFDRRQHTYNFTNGFDPPPTPNRGRRGHSRSGDAAYPGRPRTVGNNGGRPR